MHTLPHRYTVGALAQPEGDVELVTDGVAPLVSAPPVEFDGPGGRWSPESLLVGAVADCFVLSFRAIAKASRLAWARLDCSVDGTLDRVEGAMKFTRFEIAATLDVPAGADDEKALRILHKAEDLCLITNSLSAETSLSAAVNRVGQAD